jgi:hypothetical protein
MLKKGTRTQTSGQVEVKVLCLPLKVIQPCLSTIMRVAPGADQARCQGLQNIIYVEKRHKDPGPWESRSAIHKYRVCGNVRDFEFDTAPGTYVNPLKKQLSL